MRLTVIFVLFCNSIVFCQNLVPNSSFEEINDTISKFTDDHIEFKSKIKYWTTPNTASPDLITPKFDEKYIKTPSPHTGLMMIGIQSKIDWSEYIGVNLTRELTPNRTYYVEYWIRRADCIRPKMNVDQIMNKNFGVLFSSDSIRTLNENMLFGTPQINVDTGLLITNKEWVKISGYFTPKKKYSKLYLGQFWEIGKGLLNMKGYFVIDDVSVKEVTNFEFLDKDNELPIGSIIPLNNIHFISGTTDLSDTKSYALLEELAAYLKSNPSIRIRINGHTDSKGSKKSNLLLSKRRARFIAENIMKNGINNDRIEWKGFGEENPIADNEYEEGRSKNRRVEFEVIK